MDQIAPNSIQLKRQMQIVAGNHSDTRMSFSRSAVKLCSKLCYTRRIIP